MATLLPVELQRTERRVRLIEIMLCGEDAGVGPLTTEVIHSIAYLADVLAPVWHLPILDAQLVKQAHRPFFPSLQHDLDELVGVGLVDVVNFDYVLTPANQWRISATYALCRDRIEPITTAVRGFAEQTRKLDFVREVVYAASALGPEGIADIGVLDATYSDPLIGTGGLLDVDASRGGRNPTADVAARFATLSEDPTTYGDAELVHLYVRHLFRRMRVA